MWGIIGIEESKMTPRFFKLGNEVIVFIEIGRKKGKAGQKRIDYFFWGGGIRRTFK